MLKEGKNWEAQYSISLRETGLRCGHLGQREEGLEAWSPDLIKEGVLRVLKVLRLCGWAQASFPKALLSPPISWAASGEADL